MHRTASYLVTCLLLLAWPAGAMAQSNDDAFDFATKRTLIDKVEAGHGQIRITGSRQRLAKLATGTPPQLVPKAEREWRTQQDSNLRPLPSEGRG